MRVLDALLTSVQSAFAWALSTRWHARLLSSKGTRRVSRLGTVG